MSVCNFPECPAKPRNGEWCSRHSYRIDMAECQHIKTNGEICKKPCKEQFCRTHNYDRTPNKCAYVGIKIGPCLKPCKKTFCPIHNPNSIKKRLETTKICSRIEYEDRKHKKEIVNSIIADIQDNIIQVPPELYDRIISLT